MLKPLTRFVFCSSFAVFSTACSDDDGANVPRNSMSGTGGANAGGQGGSSGGAAGAGAGGSSGAASGAGGRGGGGSGGAAGCSNEQPDAGATDAGDAGGIADAGDPDASGDGGIPLVVSFANDVHPIFASRCAPCHVDDGEGGHNVGGSDVMQAYLDAVGLGTRLLNRVDGGGMPPSSAAPPNNCNGAPGTPGCLTVEEVALIAAWIAQCNPR